MRIIDKNTRYKAFRGAIRVTDENGIIVTTNADSGNREEMLLGFNLIRHNAITCHKEPTQSKDSPKLKNLSPAAFLKQHGLFF